MDVWQQISQKSPLVLLRDFSLDTKYVTALRHGKQRISLIIIQQTVYTPPLGIRMNQNFLRVVLSLSRLACLLFTPFASYVVFAKYFFVAR